MMVMFIILAAIAVAAGISVVAQRRIVYSALSLLLNLIALAGLYVLLNAQFIAMAQVIIYAGAIVVLFLFGIMLLEVDWEDLRVGQIGWLRGPGIFLALVVLAEVIYILATGFTEGTPGPYTPEFIAQQGNTRVIGQAMFTNFLLPFELASVLLLAAMVGALYLAGVRPFKPTQGPTSAWEEQARKVTEATSTAARRTPMHGKAIAKKDE